MNRFPGRFLADASGYHGGKAASTLNLVPFGPGPAGQSTWQSGAERHASARPEEHHRIVKERRPAWGRKPFPSVLIGLFPVASGVAASWGRSCLQTCSSVLAAYPSRWAGAFSLNRRTWSWPHGISATGEGGEPAVISVAACDEISLADSVTACDEFGCPRAELGQQNEISVDEGAHATD